jgi:hypothetical protein
VKVLSGCRLNLTTGVRSSQAWGCFGVVDAKGDRASSDWPCGQTCGQSSPRLRAVRRPALFWGFTDEHALQNSVGSHGLAQSGPATGDAGRYLLPVPDIQGACNFDERLGPSQSTRRVRSHLLANSNLVSGVLWAVAAGVNHNEHAGAYSAMNGRRMYVLIPAGCIGTRRTHSATHRAVDVPPSRVTDFVDFRATDLVLAGLLPRSWCPPRLPVLMPRCVPGAVHINVCLRLNGFVHAVIRAWVDHWRRPWSLKRDQQIVAVANRGATHTPDGPSVEPRIQSKRIRSCQLTQLTNCPFGGIALGKRCEPAR